MVGAGGGPDDGERVEQGEELVAVVTPFRRIAA